MNNKFMSTAFINPNSGMSRTGISTKYELYKQEKEALKNEFAEFSGRINWNSAKVNDKLEAFAQQIFEYAIDEVVQNDIIPLVLPQETMNPGDTLNHVETYGSAVYQGSYGAAVRMSRPMFKKYQATTNLKEVGLRLELPQIQNGKYSASELAEYTGGLITAWKNRMLFVNTLAGMSVYSSSGAQYTAGYGVSTATLLTGLKTLSDEADPGLIIGRRNAILQLIDNANFSNETKREFETTGMVGNAAGIPIVKVNSFTDQLYGTVYPFPNTDLWIFSEQPAGVYVQAGPLNTSNETVLKDNSMNMYFRWDDGVGIWHTDRIARIVTS